LVKRFIVHSFRRRPGLEGAIPVAPSVVRHPLRLRRSQPGTQPGAIVGGGGHRIAFALLSRR